MGEVHPLAARWPMMPDDELAALAESIATDGLATPLTLDAQGRLVDGRNRLEACRIAGVSPRYLTPPGLDSDDAIRQWISKANAQRRNVSTGQKAMAVADDLAAQGKRKNGRWAHGAKSQTSDTSHGWRVAMVQAGLVIDWRRDLVDQVIAGGVTLNDAAGQAEAARDAQAIAEAKAKREAEMLADLKDNRPDLAALVDEGKLPLADALTVRDKETADQRRAEREAEEQIQKFSVGVCSAIARLTPLTEPTLAEMVDALRLDAATTVITAADTLTVCGPRALKSLIGMASVAGRTTTLGNLTADDVDLTIEELRLTYEAQKRAYYTSRETGGLWVAQLRPFPGYRAWREAEGEAAS